MATISDLIATYGELYVISRATRHFVTPAVTITHSIVASALNVNGEAITGERARAFLQSLRDDASTLPPPESFAARAHAIAAARGWAVSITPAGEAWFMKGGRDVAQAFEPAHLAELEAAGAR